MFEELLLGATLPYIAQEHANVILDPVSLAYLLCQRLKISQQFHVPVIMLPCLKCSSALPKGIETNRLQPPPTLARHTAANVLEVLVSLRLGQWLGNWFEAFLWHTISCPKNQSKVIGLDHALLLLRCSGLSQHCAQGAKGARLWMSAAGPESVFHVAAMIAPWFKRSSWSVHKSCPLLPVHAVCVWWESDAWLLHFVGHARVPWGHFCNIVLDHGVLLLRCSGLSQQSQHLARGTKGARFVNERSWSKECLPCSCHANTWFEGCLWFRSLHICFSTSARYGIHVCLVSVTTLAWKESACGKKCLHYTLQSCCFGALVYPRLSSLAPKELQVGLWLNVSGPKSVFHVAAMIAPWLKGFAWIKPTLCFPPLQGTQSFVSVWFSIW